MNIYRTDNESYKLYLVASLANFSFFPINPSQILDLFQGN